MLLAVPGVVYAQDWWKPYSDPCTEREDVFAFTEKPAVRLVGKDKYEITFAVRGFCDVTVDIVNPERELVEGIGTVVRHLASGVLGSNAPKPFQKDSLKQTIYWDGKDDLDVYVKEPTKTRVRVMLGLKPEFEKLLGGCSGKNLPGYVVGIAIGPRGAYVFTFGTGGKSCSAAIRRFDHDGNYVSSLIPPPANMSEEKLKGLAYVEYEPGKRTVHGPDIYETVADRAHFLPSLNGQNMAGLQPAIAGEKLCWADAGIPRGEGSVYYMNVDGSFELEGMKGLPLNLGVHRFPAFAASPDGKWLYLTVGESLEGPPRRPVVYRRALTRLEPVQPFIGKRKEEEKGKYSYVPGSDNASLASPCGIACDAQGRIYVVDAGNNRVQVYSPDGAYLKTIKVDRPFAVQVHRKTGGIYVGHIGRVRGKSLSRITKFTSFMKPEKEYHVDHLGSPIMALDSWSTRPRIWLGPSKVWVNTLGGGSSGANVRIFEETGGTLKQITNFDEEARKEAGEAWFGGFGKTRKVVCDPVRETVVYGKNLVIDLKTGEYKGMFRVKGYRYTDIAFDKKGYMHIHWNPHFAFPSVSRVDPSQATPVRDRSVKVPLFFYPEVPYDYGVLAMGWEGLIPTRDQGGAKGFQDGLGVNMRGDVAEQCNIYFVPKMEDIGRRLANTGPARERSVSGFSCSNKGSYESFMRSVEEKRKRGVEIYSIKRRPGIPLAGGTIWTYEWSGELRDECIVNMGALINGAQIDEDGGIYFVSARPRTFDPSGKTYFLSGKGGTFGAPGDKGNRSPFTGTLIKRKPGKACFAILARAPVPETELPSRPPDARGRVWIEGAEWLYAGASPIVAGGCSCPTQRLHTDWYKRTFVPEAYRHSIGVLDTAGNLIMHLGQYGNFDSGFGAKSKIPVGGDNIALFNVRFVSGTDNYICFDDWSERLVVLKIAYHEEAEVGLE
jgi:hypothetical protein